MKRDPYRILRYSVFPAFCLVLGIFAFTSCGGGGGASVKSGSSGDAVTFPAITLTKIATGFSQPLQVTNAGDGSGRMFVTEKRGTVQIVRNGSVLPTPFLNITSAVKSSGEEQGLLGIAFPPNYATLKHFYVDYTSTSGVGDTVIARIPVGADGNVASPSASTTILTVPQPFANHNGGQLAFGPDGFLYIGTGDGGSEGDPQMNAQNRSRLLGKILRINPESPSTPTYAIPPGNPFNSEVWSYGLRNPWRFSFDRTTGDLFIADVGQDLYEEVNVQPAASRGGENYGWNIMEGLHCFNSPTCDTTGLTLPVQEYGHDSGNCSITGGYVYRGPNPALQGIYFYGDFCSGRIWGLLKNGTAWENKLLLQSGLRISSFGEDEAGNVYVVDFGGGDIYRIDVL